MAAAAAAAAHRGLQRFGFLNEASVAPVCCATKSASIDRHILDVSARKQLDNLIGSEIVPSTFRYYAKTVYILLGSYLSKCFRPRSFVLPRKMFQALEYSSIGPGG